MTEITATLFGALLGAIIGASGTYFGAIQIMKQERLYDAGSELRKAFYDEITALELNNCSDLQAHVILETAFKKHSIAVAEYLHFLPKCKHNEFNNAWENYHCLSGEHSLDQYDTTTGNLEKRDENRILAIERIQSLLSLTK